MLVFFQIAIGAFVSGLDAAKIYQTWPLMNGHFVPEDILVKEFVNLKSYSSASHIQFLHRIIAYSLILIFSFLFYFLLKKKIVNPKYLFIVLIAMFLQASLGVFVLVSGFKIYVASLHQLGSVFLLFSIIYLFYQVSVSKKY